MAEVFIYLLEGHRGVYNCVNCCVISFFHENLSFEAVFSLVTVVPRAKFVASS